MYSNMEDSESLDKKTYHHNDDRFLIWWEMVDSNHRSRQTTDLQSAPIGRSGNLPYSMIVRVTKDIQSFCERVF